MSHRIRLRGHWGAGPRFARAFGRPTTAGETVVLGCDAASAAGDVFLNGHLLGRCAAGEPFAFDVTDALSPRNELAFQFDATADPADCWLEIRGTSPADG